MAITIPDRTQIRLTTDLDKPMHGHALPAMLADTAMTNPSPVAVSTSGATTDPSAQAQCTPAIGDAGNAGYVGYNPDSHVPLNGPVSPLRNAVVDGFAGVVPGSKVYIDQTGADATGTASGLTHTRPTAATAGTVTITNPGAGETAVASTPVGKYEAIGVGWTATKIYFF